MTFVWNGVHDTSLLHDGVVSSGHRLADAAKSGDWSTVFEMLDDPRQPVDVNWWRPDGTAWFTVLHQAAWHGAPNDVVAALIRRGALRSLPDSRGRTPYDVRCEKKREKVTAGGYGGHERRSLSTSLRHLKPPPSELNVEELYSLNSHLADLIDGRIRGRLFHGRNPRAVLRYPPVEILPEIPGNDLWFPVPGMYGGFDISLRGSVLEVKSWCRVVGGSGQAHLVTTAGCILVDEGFV
ncbi:hypothetical protein AU190_05790 [Mycolicibacterium acapulense]|nr:hypothetical protein AU190_05790 [Mycolicibacterium acapulense]